jgi:ABC-2 type transport system permease protein
MTGEFIWLMFIDALFILACAIALLPVVIFMPSAAAVLKRNFFGYFSNPTGYVFLCLFVCLTSLAAFWPHEFFAANLANLDQLNETLPLIMLIFIPAITMGAWAEERRQGTDELLLTLPAADIDIVLGKYLAAAATFTVSLLFAQISNFCVLIALSQGDLDTGLFFATYCGYWFVGMTMLSIGLVASFLSNNLTVSFILGVIFNCPLVFLGYADTAISDNRWSQFFTQWSIGHQLEDFGRGVLSISSLSYFAMIIAVGIYLSMVLIGRRHWSGGRDGESMFLHFFVRALALIVIAAGLSFVFANHDVVRLDTTEGQISSLSPDTRKLLRELNSEYPITIEAFVSAKVPEQYVETKYDLLSKLKEFSKSSSDITLNIHENLEPFSDAATLAEDRFGITPQAVQSRSRGTLKSEQVIIAAVFSSGVNKVVIPFFDYGIPMEYELIRSITTVAKQKQKRLGIVQTDMNLMGGFSMTGGMPRQIPEQEIVAELRKQYEVEQVNPNSPIDVQKYDCLLVAQPTSLAPNQYVNLLAAIKSGVPTAIFEDPLPWFFQQVPGTGMPKQAPGGNSPFGGGGGGPQPKGNVKELWDLLQIESQGKFGRAGLYEPQLVWHDYNPYPTLREMIPKEWVFASNEASIANDGINNEDDVSSQLREVLLPVPGMIKQKDLADLEFIPLLSANAQICGTIESSDFLGNQRDPRSLDFARGDASTEPLVVAARIRGTLPRNENEPIPPVAPEAKDSEKKHTENEIDVIYVTDIDLLVSAFLQIRARPDDDETVKWQVENVTFLLNIVDSLAKDVRYLNIRKRKTRFSTLKLVEQASAVAREDADKKMKKIKEEYDEEVESFEKKQTKIIDDLKKQSESGDGTERIKNIQMTGLKIAQASQELETTKKRLRATVDREYELTQRTADQKVVSKQNSYKLWALLIPPIPPLFVGLIVWVTRRLREREGIAKSRLR